MDTDHFPVGAGVVVTEHLVSSVGGGGGQQSPQSDPRVLATTVMRSPSGIREQEVVVGTVERQLVHWLVRKWEDKIERAGMPVQQAFVSAKLPAETPIYY